jgi:hypothetical protein
MPHGTLTACFYIELVFFALCSLDLVLKAQIRYSDGEPTGKYHKQAVGRAFARKHFFTFLALSSCYMGFFYTVGYEPRVNSDQPVIWGDLILGASTPLAVGLVYLAFASVTIRNIYAPDNK